jgi:hypothetical protein
MVFIFTSLSSLPHYTMSKDKRQDKMKKMTEEKERKLFYNKDLGT